MKKKKQTNGKDQLRNSIENSHAGYFFIDPNGYFQDVNRAWLKMHKYDRLEEVIGKHYSLTQTISDLEEAQRNVEKLLSGDSIISGEFSRRCKDGSVGYHIFSANPVYLENKLAGLEGFLIDVTKQKKAEMEIAEHSRLLEALFTSSLTSLVLLDRDFNFIRVNEAYANACARNVSDFPGHNHFEFYPSEAKSVFEEVVRTKKPFQVFANPFEFPDHPEWGTTYWDWTLVPLLDSAGEVEFLVFSLHNVTERKQAEEKILVQLSELKRWQNVMLGREDRIRELKSEINELCRRGNEPIRYSGQLDDVS